MFSLPERGRAWSTNLLHSVEASGRMKAEAGWPRGLGVDEPHRLEEEEQPRLCALRSVP